MVGGHSIVICFALTDVQCHLMPLSSGRKQTRHLHWVPEERVSIVRKASKGQCSPYGLTTVGSCCKTDQKG